MKIRLPRAHRSRIWRGQCAGGDPRGRMPRAGHAARHRRALRQRESDYRGGQHAAARRGGIRLAGSSLRGLTSLAHSAYGAFSLDVPHGAPIVGAGAFGTWAGMHGQRDEESRARICGAIRRGWGQPRPSASTAQSGKANIILLVGDAGRSAQRLRRLRS